MIIHLYFLFFSYIYMMINHCKPIHLYYNYHYNLFLHLICTHKIMMEATLSVNLTPFAFDIQSYNPFISSSNHLIKLGL